MKEQASRIQYTIRGIPPEIDRLLREKAAARHRSLNQVILEELAISTLGRQRRADFSQLAGKWLDDPAFDEIIAAQRQIDWDRWK